MKMVRQKQLNTRHNIFMKLCGGKQASSLEDIESWLEANEQDPGFQIFSKEKILSSMTAVRSSEEKDDEADDSYEPN